MLPKERFLHRFIGFADELCSANQLEFYHKHHFTGPITDKIVAFYFEGRNSIAHLYN